MDARTNKQTGKKLYAPIYQCGGHKKEKMLLSVLALNLDKSKFPNLTHYHTILTFDYLEKEASENIVRKVENASNQHFLLFSPCFLPFPRQIHFFSHIYFVICKCFLFGAFQRVNLNQVD